jgi:hypothetical protein
MKQVNINKYILCFVHMCIYLCGRIFVHVFVDEFVCKYHLLVLNIQCISTHVSSPYVSVLCDPQQVALTATELRLFHVTDSYDIFACSSGRYCVFLYIHIYISFCAVKMPIYKFIIYAALNHSFR